MGDKITRQYISKKELTEILGVSLMTVNRHLKSGMIESVKFGGRVLIPVAKLGIKIYEESEPVDIPSSVTYLYLMMNNQNKMTKIGISKDPQCRHRTLTSYELNLHIISLFKFDNKKQAMKEEQILHSYFNNKRYSGEWFNLSLKNIEYINNIYSNNKVEVPK